MKGKKYTKPRICSGFFTFCFFVSSDLYVSCVGCTCLWRNFGSPRGLLKCWFDLYGLSRRHRESQVSLRSFAWGRKSWSYSLETLVPMQQRRALMSLGGVAGSQLRMYLGFGVLFQRTFRSEVPKSYLFPMVSIWVHQPSSPLCGRRLNRSDQGSCKSLGSTTRRLGLSEATPSQRLKVPDEFSGETDAQPNRASACTAWEWLDRGGAWLKCTGVCREVWLLVLACSALICRHRWVLLKV